MQQRNSNTLSWNWARPDEGAEVKQVGEWTQRPVMKHLLQDNPAISVML